ncbi:hypothetical protein MATL_G00186320 [Megalops atlanticus]|uniref:Uncharacterized protein n=1 Tax=Megalops atlanticus TaxID=7932 RepID=A0A9D3T5H4_MEGAT|nr:hypothetical protein MATL_G00186320 [Megalops atlanticus]
MSHCAAFQTQLASIMDVLAKAVVAEMLKLIPKAEVGSSAALGLDMARGQSANQSPKKSQLMETDLRTVQLVAIMEILVKEALDKIGKLVDEGCAVLRLEMSRSQNENEELKKKLLLMESELKTTRRHGKLRTQEVSADKPSRSVGVQAGAEFTTVSDSEEHHSTMELCSDGEPTAVVEDTPLHSVITCDKSTDMDDRPASLLVKCPQLEMSPVNSDSQRGLKMNHQSKSEV